MEENRYYQFKKYARQENVPLPLLLMNLNFNLVFHYVVRGKFLKSAGNFISLHLSGVNQQLRERSSVIPSLVGVTKDVFGLSKNVRGGKNVLRS